MEGGGQADGGRNEVDGKVEGAGRRTEKQGWWAGGCRSQAEVTGRRAGNRPSPIAGVGKKLVFECYLFSFFVLTNLVVLFNLRTGGGRGSHTW